MMELVEKGIEGKLLEEVKNYTRNNFPFEVETPNRKLAMMLDDEIYGSKDFAKHFEERIKAVTSEDVKRVVKKYLFPDNVAIVVVVSNGKKFIDELLSPKTNLAPSEPIFINSNPFWNIIYVPGLLNLQKISCNMLSLHFINAWQRQPRHF